MQSILAEKLSGGAMLPVGPGHLFLLITCVYTSFVLFFVELWGSWGDVSSTMEWNGMARSDMPAVPTT